MEQIACHFLNAWVPATGLSPIMNIWEKNWRKVITNWPLQEIAWGFYIYNFNEYSPEKFYLYLVDWTATLSDSDRYISGNNELDAYSNKNTWGRTVAATVSYKPDFDKLHAWMQSLQSTKPIDLKWMTSEIASLKKLLANKKSDWSKEDIIDRISSLERSLMVHSDMFKEEMKAHLSEMTSSWLDNVIKSVLNEYKTSNKTYLETINGLSSSLAEKLDTLPNKTELTATGTQINSKLEEVIMTLAANYIKDHVTEMFDFSFKRKQKEIPVKTDEEDILDLLTK